MRERCTDPAERRVVHLPGYFFVVGCIPVAAFGVIIVMTQSALSLIIAGVLAAMGLCLMVAYYNDRVIYDDKQIIHKHFFGYKTVYSYSDITEIIGENAVLDSVIRFRDGKITLDKMMIGRLEFISFAKRQYKSAHREVEVPIRLSSNSKLFKGNLKNPKNFILRTVIVAVLISAFAAFLVVYANRTVERDTVESKVAFDNTKEFDGDLYLQAGGEVYRVRGHYSILEERKDFFELLNGGTAFDTTWYETEEDGMTIRDVHLISANGKVFVRPGAWDKYNSSGIMILAWLFIGFLVFWLLFSGACVFVALDPNRINPKIRRLFFSDSELNLKKGTKTKTELL